MVDVIEGDPDVGVCAVAAAGHGVLAGVQRDDVADRLGDVVDGEHRIRQRRIDAELAVDLVAADLGEVVALGVEVEVLQQVLCRLDRRRLSRAQLLVDVEQRVFAGLDGVLGKRLADRLEIAELLEDLRAGPAEGLEQHGDRLLALAVQAHTHLIALVDLELKPGTARRDDLGGVDVLVRGLVGSGLEVGAGRADELGDDDALGAVDDEGALVGHEREVAHEHGLALDLAGVVVHELGGDEQRRRVGHVAFLALIDGVLRRLEAVFAERQAHRAGEVLDRGDLLEDVLQARGGGNGVIAGLDGLGDAVLPLLVADQPVEAVGLQAEEIRQRQRLVDLRERNARGWVSGPGVFVGGGQWDPSEWFTWSVRFACLSRRGDAPPHTPDTARSGW